MQRDTTRYRGNTSFMDVGDIGCCECVKVAVARVRWAQRGRWGWLIVTMISITTSHITGMTRYFDEWADDGVDDDW